VHARSYTSRSRERENKRPCSLDLYIYIYIPIYMCTTDFAGCVLGLFHCAVKMKVQKGFFVDPTGVSHPSLIEMVLAMTGGDAGEIDRLKEVALPA
jgi:hypothetical protein